jgi:hypothetical protein
MNSTSNADARKNVLWPGATPLLARVTRQNPFGLRGVAPGHSVFALLANRKAIPRPHSRQFLSEQTDAAHMRKPGPTQENPCLCESHLKP